MDRFIRGLAGVVLAAALAVGAPDPARAQGYFGAGFGWTKADLGDIEDLPGVEVDDESMALRLVAGYRFWHVLALELFYTDLGAFSAGSGILKVDAKGEGYSALVFLPLGDGADLFAKAGVYRWDVTGTGERKQTEPVYGLGLQLPSRDRAFGIRFEYERYVDVGKDIGGSEGIDVDVFSANLIYSF